MLRYGFMIRALLAGMILSIIVPLIGVVVVNRRTSNIGDALSHTSLVGISLGLILGFSPIVGSIISCLIAALLIDKVRGFFPENGDMATVIVMSVGVGLASILSDYIPGAQNLESFMFGSIVTVSNLDLGIIGLTALIIIFLFKKFYWQILSITVDSTDARLSGVNVKFIDTLFTFMMALTIAIASRTVGALMVSSLIVLPVATSLIFSKNYSKLIINSCLFALIYVVLGICASYYMALKPGGTIVIVGLSGLLLTDLYIKLKSK